MEIEMQTKTIGDTMNNDSDNFYKLIKKNMKDKDNKSGFFDLPNYNECNDPEHDPPKYLHIPQGKGYKHICQRCGKVTILINHKDSF